ncbi:MAG: tRNA uridine-5-carboxymethylaminomethyl(34) synthesis GTPase MnmE [Candidatus Zixiibacteriota bacterium]
MNVKWRGAKIADDTIAAIITPPGQGGIAALRLAGRASLRLLRFHFRSINDIKLKSSAFRPFLMRYGLFVDEEGQPIDEVMAVYMPRNRSYTGADQVELFCHGGQQIVRLILDCLIASGARAAEPGEFTRMAFLSGRIDLSRAEAVAEIIAASTQTSYYAAREHLIGAYSTEIDSMRTNVIHLMAEVEASVDFPDEEIESAQRESLLASIQNLIERTSALVATYHGGRIIREGFRIVIGGRPNAGKSSLFNKLLKQERALVMPTPGTTRDYLSEWIDLAGYKVNLIDTAGLRQSGGPIERAGQRSAQKLLTNADLILWVVDSTARSWRSMLAGDLKSLGHERILLAFNKIDLIDSGPEKPNVSRETTTRKELALVDSSVKLSCVTGKGLKALASELEVRIRRETPDLTDGAVVTSARHKQKLSAALKHLKSARRKIRISESPELTAFDLRQTAISFDELTGRIYNEEILGQIFSKFCIGK